MHGHKDDRYDREHANGGLNLPSGDSITVQVYVDVPNEERIFTGSIKIWNTENYVNYGTISVQLTAPVEKTILPRFLFWKGLEGFRFPLKIDLNTDLYN